MKKNILFILMTVSIYAHGQYTKEKLRDVLCGKDQKTWQVSGVNVDRPEKSMTFRINNTAEVEDREGKKKEVKWSLQSSDNIRWFIDIGEMKYEMIVSYTKKGEQYVKLTHRGGDGYELKLNHSQKKQKAKK